MTEDERNEARDRAVAGLLACLRRVAENCRRPSFVTKAQCYLIAERMRDCADALDRGEGERLRCLTERKFSCE